ncbi:N-6 DNA methylase [Microbispora catharanthi]|uniref:N-6 DNA methylase n=1 Tax=Microbispora catharanthi TaxID=1712871 RepID=A0A5N6C0K7_9ACTN|nr:N-6 DNA methylase [Microbispora catharanthi]KAB8185973.1 N-6 DNA methylase [Microbispora catharanthi]
MSQPSVHVTAAEIARFAGVTRATVSNWRRRHPDFPGPVAGSEASPLYDLTAVRAWLKSRGQTPTVTPIEELRNLLRLRIGTPVATRLLPFVYATARLDSAEQAKLAKLTDNDLAIAATRAVTAHAADLPVTQGEDFGPDDAELLRAVLNGLLAEGGQAVLDVLAERELTDTHSIGAYRTPRPLADLMARFLHTDDGSYPAAVFDPACGTGSLLEAAGRQGAMRLLGQDLLEVQALRSAVRLKIALSDRHTVIQSGDSIRADAFADLQADAVLCSPPFADRDRGHDTLIYDPRWTYGVPPRSESELAWVQHALAHLAPGGYAVLLLPPGTGFRSPGRSIRTELLKAGALRAVIALPPGIVVPLHIGLHLWVLRRPDQNPPTDSILMMDLSRQSDRRETIDWTSLTDTVLASWHSYLSDPAHFEPVPELARAVPVVELFGDNVDLTPVRHLHRTKLDPAEVSRQARALLEQLHRSLDDFSAAIDAQSWADGETESKTWRTATVSDLAKGGMLTIRRTVRDTSDTPLPEEHRTRPVLRSRDVATGSRATGAADEDRAAPPIVVETGDVLLPRVAARDQIACRVADEDDAGCLLGPNLTVLRVDPARIDPWFLAGFLLSEENLVAATGLRQDVSLEPSKLKVPLLPLREQHRYGRAFHNLHWLEHAARKARNLAFDTTRTISDVLSRGALAPPDS